MISQKYVCIIISAGKSHRNEGKGGGRDKSAIASSRFNLTLNKCLFLNVKKYSLFCIQHDPRYAYIVVSNRCPMGQDPLSL